MMTSSSSFPLLGFQPILSESIDGQPLVTTVRELLPSLDGTTKLFPNFPYHRLPNNGTFFNSFLRPEGVLFWLIFYHVSKPALKWIIKQLYPTPPKSSTSSSSKPSSSSSSLYFTVLVAIHNLLLAIFSFVVAYHVWPIYINHGMKHGWYDAYCDPNGTLWKVPSEDGDDKTAEAGGGNFGTWAIIFYISKFYEFVDTYVLICKQKEPSFLQVFHHTGVALCMWMGVVSQASWLFYIASFNSVIHTLMYTYFFIKTLYPKLEIKAAKFLTMGQIAQFVTGNTCTMGFLVLGPSCVTGSSRFGLICAQVYVFSLIGLFVAFAKRKYKKA